MSWDCAAQQTSSVSPCTLPSLQLSLTGGKGPDPSNSGAVSRAYDEVSCLLSFALILKFSSLLCMYGCGGHPHAMMGWRSEDSSQELVLSPAVRAGIELRSSDLCVNACWSVLQTQSKYLYLFFPKSCCTYGGEKKLSVVDSPT